ncbi:hypothetical protein V492_03726, partial [Pseudogymnoascus sp. VKM F-4246]
FTATSLYHYYGSHKWTIFPAESRETDSTVDETASQWRERGVHLLATTSSTVAEPGVNILPARDSKVMLVPSLLSSVPEEQKLPSEKTHAAATAASSATTEATLASNDRRMTMSSPPKIHHQRPEYCPRPITPCYTGGERGVQYLKRHHLRALEEREQESKTSNIALEGIRRLGSVKKVVDRAKSVQIKETDIWREEEEGKDQEWGEKEMLRKELNELFRQW